MRPAPLLSSIITCRCVAPPRPGPVPALVNVQTLLTMIALLELYSAFFLVPLPSPPSTVNVGTAPGVWFEP